MVVVVEECGLRKSTSISKAIHQCSAKSGLTVWEGGMHGDGERWWW